MALMLTVNRHFETHEGFRGVAILISGQLADGMQVVFRASSTDIGIMSGDPVDRVYPDGAEDPRPYYADIMSKQTKHEPSDFAVSVGTAVAELY
eukprot:827177-Amphidinium_carterae.1